MPQKLEFSDRFIFATWCRRPVRNPSFTPSGCKGIVMRNVKFVANVSIRKALHKLRTKKLQQNLTLIPYVFRTWWFKYSKLRLTESWIELSKGITSDNKGYQGYHIRQQRYQGYHIRQQIVSSVSHQTTNCIMGITSDNKLYQGYHIRQQRQLWRVISSFSYTVKP